MGWARQQWFPGSTLEVSYARCRLSDSARRSAKVGQLVEVWTDDPGSKENMASWCKNTGHELVDHSADETNFKYTVRRSR